MHMLVLMYYCIYMFSYGPYGPEIKHYYYIIIIITLPLLSKTFPRDHMSISGTVLRRNPQTARLNARTIRVS